MKKEFLNFVLFMCAKHSSLTGKDVRIINFQNNNLRSLISFLPSKKFLKETLFQITHLYSMK